MSARGYTVVPNIVVREPVTVAAAGVKSGELLVDLGGRHEKIKTGAWLIFQEVLRRSYNGTNVCSASHETLGLAAGLKRGQVGKHVKRLLEIGLIAQVGRRVDHLELVPLVTAASDGSIHYEHASDAHHAGDVHSSAHRDVHSSAHKEGTTGKENSSFKEAARNGATQRRARDASVGDGEVDPRVVEEDDRARCRMRPSPAERAAVAEAMAAQGPSRPLSETAPFGARPLGSARPLRARAGGSAAVESSTRVSAGSVTAQRSAGVAPRRDEARPESPRHAVTAEQADVAVDAPSRGSEVGPEVGEADVAGSDALFGVERRQGDVPHWRDWEAA